MSITLDGTSGITNDATDLNYTGTLTGGTGVVNLGSGQFYKDASGNVGIGTSSPGVKLDVSNGTIRAIQTATSGTSIVYATNSGSNNVGFWKQGSTAGAYGVIAAENGAVFNTSGDLCIVNDASSKNIIFANNGAASERMRIDSSGNLLVGTTSATPNPGVSIAPAGNITAGNSAGGSGFEFATFRRSAVQIGSITQSGTTAVLYNTSSDYRLKHDIQPMTGALAKVALLKPCTYKWNVDDSNGEGFIAHELAEVCPSAVSGEKDAVNEDGSIKPQGIDTSFLVATLTAAIQEQQAINDAQAQTIESLTARVAALEQA